MITLARWTPQLVWRLQLAGTALALACLGPAAWNWWAPTQDLHDQAFRASQFAGLLLALVFAPALAREEADPTRWRWAVGGAVAGALLLAALIMAFGHRQFGGLDHSIVVDLGWRLFNGQRPYVDFPSSVPIGVQLGCGWAYQAFGPTWTALVAWEAAFAALTFTWMVALLWALSHRPFSALLAAFTAQALANVVTSYWWYNPATSTCAVVAFLGALACWRRPEAVWPWASFVAASALLATMKPTVAGVFLALAGPCFLVSPAHRARAMGAIVSAVALVLAALAAAGVSPFDVLSTYLSVSGRGFDIENFTKDLVPEERTVGLLAANAMLWPFIAFAFQRPTVSGRRLAVVAFLAGAYGFVTNMDHMLVDLPLGFMALWWLAEGAPEPEFEARTYVAALAICLATHATVVGSLRDRVRAIGPWFQPTVSARQAPTAYFKGLHADAWFFNLLDEMQRAVAERPGASVAFGPRLQFGYAAFGLPSPIGQPVHWQPGVAHGMGLLPGIVAGWKHDQPQVLVFVANDRTCYAEALTLAISRDYVLRPGYDRLDVYWRRDGSRPGPLPSVYDGSPSPPPSGGPPSASPTTSPAP